MKIVFDDSNYRNFHHKTPRGGHQFKIWDFKVDELPNRILHACGKYSEAKESIRWQVREACGNLDTVTVRVLFS